MPWRKLSDGRWRRNDGACVIWDQRTPHSNPALPTARMWTAWEPDPSQAYLSKRMGPSMVGPRRWKTAQAAMRAVDREFPENTRTTDQGKTNG